jgi:hypothetical protein|tara:strand:+ start:5322 stop:5741 length:420 start_codon:yes stop_codon:yes gene_type:complete
MATASTNAWKVNVEETIQTGIKSEFSLSLPVFRSRDFQQRGNQFAILKGERSESQNTMYSLVANSYNLSFEFFMSDLKRNDLSIKKFFNQVSRIEETFYSLLDIDPLFSIEINGIDYEDDIEFNGYRKATFDMTVRNVR